MAKKIDISKLKNATKLTIAGRNSFDNFGCVNPPVYHASTILFKSLEEMRSVPLGKYPHSYYGRYGTELTKRAEEAISALDSSDGVLLTSSGVTAITIAILAFVKTGDHILITDSAYDPTRFLAETELKKFGIETEYYDPKIGSGIEKLIRKNTSLIFTESPGSLTFEVQDIPAICKVAKKHKIVVLNDNTYATGINFDPFKHGVDVAIQSATKYLGGHSDIMAGVIGFNKKHEAKLKRTARNIGSPLSPDDTYLLLRGMRTLAIRLKQHEENALFLCNKLAKESRVKTVLCPALASHPDNKLFKKQFTASTGLFSIVLDKEYTDKQLGKFLDNLKLYGMGYSWGGFESLIIPANLKTIRTATSPDFGGTVLRLHAGLEDKQDLWEDLKAGLDRL